MCVGSPNFISDLIRESPIFSVDSEPSNFEKLCLVNVGVKYFSKLCFGTSKIQLN